VIRAVPWFAAGSVDKTVPKIFAPVGILELAASGMSCITRAAMGWFAFAFFEEKP
jgi:hypothetical protein